MEALLAQEKRAGFLYKDLITDELRTRLAGRIVQEESCPEERAERIMDAALGFLKLCADYPGQRFAPAKLVDVGWHTFLVYTREYQTFCMQYAGRFIHHAPNDVPGRIDTSDGAGMTVKFMEERDIPFDLDVWVLDELGCKQQCGKCTVDCRDDCHVCTSDR